MTINGHHVTAVIDSGATLYMNPSIVDLVHAKTKQANEMVILRHHETTAICSARTEQMVLGVLLLASANAVSITCSPYCYNKTVNQSSWATTSCRNHYSTPRTITSLDININVWCKLSSNRSASIFFKAIRNRLYQQDLPVPSLKQSSI